MAKERPKKPGIMVNTTKGQPVAFTIEPSTEPVTVFVWTERKGKMRIRSTKRLTFPTKSG